MMNRMYPICMMTEAMDVYGHSFAYRYPGDGEK